jgi:predicted RecB family nuclease
LVPDLGRARRDILVSAISTVQQLAAADVEEYVRGKKTVFPGVGPSSLRKFQQRARARVEELDPYLTKAIDLPRTGVELFFDIETDPFRDVCYLHGFVERRGGDSNSEAFHAFFAKTPEPEDEEEAFRNAYAYLTTRMPCAVYYYTKYERTEWKKLAKKYPSVASEEDVEALFEKPTTIDLYYDVVKPKTVWPTRDHSIKTLAVRCGFEWRDESPSGVESIEWYHRWVEIGNESIKQRILEYNEDDCRAMRVLVDAVQSMAVRSK